MIYNPPQPITDRRFLRADVLAAALALSLGLIVTRGAAAEQMVYYVDNQSPTCTAVGPGTEAEPYCSITAAMAAHRGPGITIAVKPGTYREQLTIAASGEPEAPYIIRAAGPGVRLEGADDFTNEALWIQPGPAPVSGAFSPQAVDHAWLAPGVNWSAQQVFVDGRRLVHSSATPGMLPTDAFTWVDGEGLYVNLGGENPGRHEILVGRRTHAFRMASKSWVRIEGFEIARMEDVAIGVYTGCSDITIAQNQISFSESYGIKTVGGLRIMIEENSVSESAFHGIGLTAGSTDCVVRDNECFRNAQPDTRAAKGIYLWGSPNNRIVGNATYENQDTGVQVNVGSDSCVLYNNRSWRNGDHGYDHLDVDGTIHLNNVAYGNYKDGFSIEGRSPNSQLHNCISVNNGLTTGRFDLWVNAVSAVGFTSDYNIFWNSTNQEPIKIGAIKYALLSDYRAASGQDEHSLQADPMFVDAEGGDFHPLPGSPAIDAGSSEVPYWPTYDESGRARFDDPFTPDAGAGPITFADIGAYEYVPDSEQAAIDYPAPTVRTGDRIFTTHAPVGSADVLALSSGFPNPSRGPVDFALDLPRDARVEWTVYDLQGRAVWSESRSLAAGRAQLRWDGTGATGEPAATGVYLVRALVDGTQLTRRLIRF